VLVTSGIHSTEVGRAPDAALLAYRLASDTSLATRTILDNVILWLVPRSTRTGLDRHPLYNHTVGTAAEGTEPPELYHHYTGTTTTATGTRSPRSRRSWWWTRSTTCGTADRA